MREPGLAVGSAGAAARAAAAAVSRAGNRAGSAASSAATRSAAAEVAAEGRGEEAGRGEGEGAAGAAQRDPRGEMGNKGTAQVAGCIGEGGWEKSASSTTWVHPQPDLTSTCHSQNAT